MNEWLSLLIGSGIGGALVTAFFARRSQKEKNELDNNVELWDRTYKLIENLETQVATFKQLYTAEKEENEELKEIINEMEAQITKLKKELKEHEKSFKEEN